MKKHKDVQVCEVIISNQLLRGNGNTEPYRRVRQVFTKDGELIAENDSETFCATDLVHFANSYNGNTGCAIEHVNIWLKSIQR